MTNILLTGYYGKGNIGDEIMVDIIKRNLKEYEVTIAVNQNNLDKESINRYKNNLFIYNSLSEIYHLLKNKDFLIWGGGTCLHNRGYCGLFFNIFAFLLGVKIIWTNIGIEKPNNIKSKLLHLLVVNMASLIIARDEESYKYLKRVKLNRFNVFQSEELVFLLGNYDSHNSSKKQYVSIIPHVVHGYDMDTLVNSYVQVAEQTSLKLKNRKICLVSFCDNVDGELIRKISSNISFDFKIIKSKDLVEALNILRASKLIISGRFHGVILGDLYRSNVIGINYSLKMTSYFEKNKSGRSLPVSSFVNGDYSFEKLLLQSRFNLSEKKRSEYYKRAMINISKMKKFINENL